jgi:hypothetical protein
MKFVEPRPFADPDAAARKLVHYWYVATSIAATELRDVTPTPQRLDLDQLGRGHWVAARLMQIDTRSELLA